MHKKAGIELSMGFIIFLIIALVVFVGVLGIANKFFSRAHEIQANQQSI